MLDYDFISRAEQITSFNLSTKDFETLENRKKEIQYLFTKYFFPEFNLSDTIDIIDQNALNMLMLKLKQINLHGFNNLYNYNLKGLGPGEILLYYLVNTAILGGGSSAGEDLIIVNGNVYEIKAIQKTSNNCAVDFKLGGTVNLSSIINELIRIRDRLELSDSRRSEIKKTNIDLIKQKAPNTFKDIETEYKTITHKEYFGKHEIIFMNNKNKSRLGLIEKVKHVCFDDISIERVTSGTAKPIIRLD